MKKIIFKKWEHITNSLILITIIGGVITYFVETEYAKRYKIWIKTYFTPTAKKLLKEALKNDLVLETIKGFSDEVVKKTLNEVPNLDNRVRELIITTKDKALNKVVKKLKGDK